MAINTMHYAVAAHANDICRASAWLEHCCSALDVSSEQILRLDLCLNEALANIIEHGGPSAQEIPVLLALEISSDKNSRQAALSVSDNGRAFNPLAAPIKAPAPTLAEATPGGLGLTMMKASSERIDYDFREGRNHLTFIVRWSVEQNNEAPLSC